MRRMGGELFKKRRRGPDPLVPCGVPADQDEAVQELAGMEVEEEGENEVIFTGLDPQSPELDADVEQARERARQLYLQPHWRQWAEDALHTCEER